MSPRETVTWRLPTAGVRLEGQRTDGGTAICGGAMSGTHGREPIVVGVNPDPSKRLALAWAADQGERQGLPVWLVHAQKVPTGG